MTMGAVVDASVRGAAALALATENNESAKTPNAARREVVGLRGRGG